MSVAARRASREKPRRQMSPTFLHLSILRPRQQRAAHSSLKNSINQHHQHRPTRETSKRQQTKTNSKQEGTLLCQRKKAYMYMLSPYPRPIQQEIRPPSLLPHKNFHHLSLPHSAANKQNKKKCHIISLTHSSGVFFNITCRKHPTRLEDKQPFQLLSLHRPEARCAPDHRRRPRQHPTNQPDRDRVHIPPPVSSTERPPPPLSQLLPLLLVLPPLSLFPSLLCWPRSKPGPRWCLPESALPPQVCQSISADAIAF